MFLYSLTTDATSCGDDDEAAPTRLETALGLLDWTHGFKVSSFSPKHRRSVLRTVESKRLETEFDSECIFYHLPRDRVDSLPPLDLLVYTPLSTGLFSVIPHAMITYFISLILL